MMMNIIILLLLFRNTYIYDKCISQHILSEQYMNIKKCLFLEQRWNVRYIFINIYLFIANKFWIFYYDAIPRCDGIYTLGFHWFPLLSVRLW